jgi:hypothetical protein
VKEGLSRVITDRVTLPRNFRAQAYSMRRGHDIRGVCRFISDPANFTISRPEAKAL